MVGRGRAAVSISAHKLGGPVGVGALVLRRGYDAVPLLHGGTQQRARSGTMDVAGAAAFAAVVDLAEQRLRDSAGSAGKREVRERLAEGIAEAVRRAAGQLEAARIRAAEGSEPSLVFNRRFQMVDGTVGWNPGKRNPGIVRPAGPVDPRVAVITVDSPSGAAIATVVNYALHLDTVGGTELSADYPYTLARLVSGARGGGVTLFQNGCAGNINHIDVSDPRPQKGHEEAARIGTVLYFLFFLLMPWYTARDKTLPVPERVTM